jgi:capsular exopolysaccharide synthesis family protein
MSWFYEALQRAQRESTKPRSGNGTELAGIDSDSFLVEMNDLASFSLDGSSSVADVPAGAPVATATAAATATATKVAEPAVQIPSVASAHLPAHSDEAAAAQAGTARNQYRSLELPVKKNSRLIFQTDRHSLAAEQFRVLRRKLSQDFPNGGVLIVTSPTEGDGKTLTSINLCSCFAEVGEPTLLLEADLRRPSLGKVLSRPSDAPGVEDVLAGDAHPAEAIYAVEDLRFCAAMFEKIPRDPSKLINGRAFRELLAWSRRNFRWIVLDSSPVLPAADVVDLMPQVDGVLLVIRAESTPREVSKRSFDVLGKRLHGVIMNGATVDSNPHYRYLSKYYGGPAK